LNIIKYISSTTKLSTTLTVATVTVMLECCGGASTVFSHVN